MPGINPLLPLINCALIGLITADTFDLNIIAMKYPPNSFCPIPTLVVPVVFMTLLLFYQVSKGQSFVSNLSPVTNGDGLTVVAKLDQTSIINSGYTTFYRYYLEGNVLNEAVIRISNTSGKTIKELNVEPVQEGSIMLPSNFLPEGSYKVAFIVDGAVKDERSLRIVR